MGKELADDALPDLAGSYEFARPRNNVPQSGRMSKLQLQNRTVERKQKQQAQLYAQNSGSKRQSSGVSSTKAKTSKVCDVGLALRRSLGP